MTISEGDRLDYKIAIMRSGRYQYQIAHEIGVTEWRLSIFLNGRGTLKPAQLARLQQVLGLKEIAHVRV